MHPLRDSVARLYSPAGSLGSESEVIVRRTTSAVLVEGTYALDVLDELRYLANLQSTSRRTLVLWLNALALVDVALVCGCVWKRPLARSEASMAGCHAGLVVLLWLELRVAGSERRKYPWMWLWVALGCVAQRLARFFIIFFSSNLVWSSMSLWISFWRSLKDCASFSSFSARQMARMPI